MSWRNRSGIWWTGLAVVAAACGPGDSASQDGGSGAATLCTSLPSEPTSVAELSVARAHHDVIFDADGHLIGSDGFNLIRADLDDGWDVYAPMGGPVEQLAWLPNGDLVAADASGLLRITADGGSSRLTADEPTYAVIVGPDGLVYSVTANGWIRRVDPATGEREDFVTVQAFPSVLAFSPDATRLYVGTTGTVDESAAVFAVDLGPDLQPTGDGYAFATGVGEGFHDGIGVDSCGDVYVTDFSTKRLYRITPDGEPSILKQWTDTSYGHGLEWGSGVGGFRSDALYMPQPFDGDTVVEVVVGVGSAWP